MPIELFCGLSIVVYIAGAICWLISSGFEKKNPDGEDAIVAIFWPIWFIRLLWRGFWKEWHKS